MNILKGFPSARHSFALTAGWRQHRGGFQFGGALSGRDRAAADKTLDGRLKLLYSDPETPVSDDEHGMGSQIRA